MKQPTVLSALLAMALLFVSPPTEAQETIIIQIPGAPLDIRTYAAAVIGEERLSRDGIEHRVTVENVSDDLIVAYSISFVTFDAFERRMGAEFEGYSMTPILPGRTNTSVWQNNPLMAVLFERYGLGVAWATRARFSSGRIWEADGAEAQRLLHEIEVDLPAARHRTARDRARPPALTGHEAELEEMRQRNRAAQEEARRRMEERNEERRRGNSGGRE
jgi:hypothetical protein